LTFDQMTFDQMAQCQNVKKGWVRPKPDPAGSAQAQTGQYRLCTS
jgi:hypothetical protein